MILGVIRVKNENKNKKISLRLTEKEYNNLLLNSIKSDMSLSNFIRQILFNNLVKINSTYKLNLEYQKEFIKELNSIGVNLNQITKVINTNKKQGFNLFGNKNQNSDKIEDELKKIRSELVDLSASLREEVD